MVLPMSDPRGASIVLHYDFSALVQFEALGRALEDFRHKATAPGGTQAFEDFLGYRDFAARSRRYGG